MGIGPHLCFLHGFCENRSIWNSIVSYLESRYTIISIDLPGFGKSSDISFSSIPQVAQQIYDLLKFEDINEVVLLGHSMGGYIVAEFMHRHPSLLKGAGFIHSTACADSIDKKENRDKLIRFVKTNGAQKFFPLFIEGLVASRNIARLKLDLLTLVQPTKGSSVVAALESMKAREDRTDAVAQFSKPILFLMGSEDSHYPKEEIFGLASKAQKVQIEIIDEVGHLSMFEDEIASKNAIKRFLNFIDNSD